MLSKFLHKKIFSSFIRTNSNFPYYFSSISPHSSLLSSLRSSSDDILIYQKICDYVVSPEISQDPLKLGIFLDFYKEMRLAEKERLISFASSFQKMIIGGISIKGIDENYLILLIDFIFNYPFILKENRPLFNALDSILLHHCENQERIKKIDNYITSLLQFAVVSANSNQGSLRLIKAIENEFLLANTSFTVANAGDLPPILSCELLAEVILSGARNMGYFSKDFLMKIADNFLKYNYEEKLETGKMIDTLYAIGLLNINMPLLYEKAFNKLKEEKELKSEQYIKIAWAYCIYKAHFLKTLEIEDFLKEKLGNGKGLKGLHKFKYIEVIAFLENEEEKIPNNKREEEGGKEDTTLLQNDVKIILKVAKIPFETEKLIKNLYRVDFLIDPNIIIEVNGPIHFGFRSEDQSLNGKTLLKTKILEKKGFKVVNISYGEWYGLRGVNKKIEFLLERLYTQ